MTDTDTDIRRLRDAAAALDDTIARIREQQPPGARHSTNYHLRQLPDYQAAMGRARDAFDATPAHYQQVCRTLTDDEDGWDSTQVALVDAATQLIR